VAIVRRGRIVADETIEVLRGRARRRVEVLFRDAEAARRSEPPSALVVLERSGARLAGELDGPAGALAAWLAGQYVVDFVVHPPDLETLFRGFYREER
jgi:hypothetical protein